MELLSVNEARAYLKTLGCEIGAGRFRGDAAKYESSKGKEGLPCVRRGRIPRYGKLGFKKSDLKAYAAIKKKQQAWGYVWSDNEK